MTPIDPARLIKAQRPTSGVATPLRGSDPAVSSSPARSGSIKAGAAPSTGAATPLSGGEAPVDADRVAEIRKAVEQGRYPIVPARIADAMIAASFLLRTPE